MSFTERALAAAFALLIAGCAARAPTEGERAAVLLTEAPRTLSLDIDPELPKPSIRYRGDADPGYVASGAAEGAIASLRAGPFAILMLPIMVPAGAVVGSVQATKRRPVLTAPLDKLHGGPDLCAVGIDPVAVAAQLSNGARSAMKESRNRLLGPEAPRGTPVDGVLKIWIRSITLTSSSHEILSDEDPHFAFEVALGAKVQIHGAERTASSVSSTWSYSLTEWRANSAGRLREEIGDAAAKLAATAVAALDARASKRAIANVEFSRLREHEEQQRFTRERISNAEAAEWGTIARTWRNPEEVASDAQAQEWSTISAVTSTNPQESSPPRVKRAALPLRAMPKTGDRWDYVYNEEATHRRQEARVTVSGAGPDFVAESVQGGARESAATYTAGPVFRSNAFWAEFSPYMSALPGLEPGNAWENLPVSVVSACTRATASCRASARAYAAEDVQTPAGEFNAMRIVVRVRVDDLTRPTGVNMSGEREYTFWYAAEAKRLVRAQARTLRGTSFDYDYTVELVAYELH